ncbi:hypothetical protein [Tanticharoenia sakaeratensis]|uniref:Phosphatidate cytidylyltransferase n=1 Tax=Tanticharoenia sakaeratensis NBRC 103193 TaxID=1231623 RepID=A0A0D6MJY0_9PROT|nr:hypothetical protein [Tanticharoenia sakaeratensis]GAN53776.1 hypothetical protein Tasa_010_323 [Tanticharoenia sakaeratensis NBRC 103193]GBQ16949.1 hypothetical protein AA103193_0163 [Tanticharoenia sakaeratensis NBRC 103193]
MTLTKRLIAELTAPADPAAQAGAGKLAATGRVLAVIYYGSTLRAPDPAGIMDFYVIVDEIADWPASGFGRLGQRLLPPNVGYLEFMHDSRVWRAKYAVMTARQFRARSGLRSRDTTIWARFCQPARLVWVRDPAAADLVLDLVRRCVVTASIWAARLGPVVPAAPVDFWRMLMMRTYDAELRVEKPDRALHLLDGPLGARAAAILTEAWSAAGLSWQQAGSLVRPHVPDRAQYLRKWAGIRKRGRVLNVMRLVKAAFTFENGADYLSWKIVRHTGMSLDLGPFARRHPLLALPFVLPRIRRAFRARRQG